MQHAFPRHFMSTGSHLQSPLHHFEPSPFGHSAHVGAVWPPQSTGGGGDGVRLLLPRCFSSCNALTSSFSMTVEEQDSSAETNKKDARASSMFQDVQTVVMLETVSPRKVLS